MRGRGPCGCGCQERCSQRPVCPTPQAQQSQGSPPPPPPRRQRPRSRLLNDGFRETPGKGASCAHRGRPGSAALRGRMNATRERPRRNAYVSSFVLPNHRLPRAARVAASLRSAQPAGAPQSGASRELAAQELSAHAHGHGHVHAHAHVPAVRARPCCAHAPRPAPRSAHPLGLAGRTPAPTRFASVPPVRGIRKDRGATCPSAVAALTRVRPAGVRRAAAPPRVLGGGGCESEGRRRLGARLRLRGVRARGEACGASSSGLVNDPVSHPQADSGARSPWGRVRLATFKGTVCEQCV